MAPSTARPADIHATPRELDVLRGIWAGHTNKDIAAALRLSLSAVALYRMSLHRKLHVHNTAELLRASLAHRLIDPTT